MQSEFPLSVKDAHGRQISLLNEPSSALEPIKPKANKRRYHCGEPGCNKSFTTSGHLARHNRIHTGEKNFQCLYPGCPSRFSRQDNMMQHYRTHVSSKSRRPAPLSRLSSHTHDHDHARIRSDASAVLHTPHSPIYKRRSLTEPTYAHSFHYPTHPASPPHSYPFMMPSLPKPMPLEPTTYRRPQRTASISSSSSSSSFLCPSTPLHSHSPTTPHLHSPTKHEEGDLVQVARPVSIFG